MKAIFIALSCVVLSFGTAVNGMSLERMEACISAWTLPEGQNWVGAQTQDGPQFVGYLRGFLGGVSAAPYLGDKPPGPLNTPEEWMFDPRKAGPSIMAFLRLNKPTTFKTGQEGSCASLMMAWYLASHSKADALQRQLAKVMIANYFEPGKLAASTSSAPAADTPRLPVAGGPDPEAQKRYLAYLKKLRDENAAAEIKTLPTPPSETSKPAELDDAGYQEKMINGEKDH